jgi:fumarate reductase subunit D
MLALPLLDAVEQAGNTGTDLGPLAAQVGDVVLQIGALGVAFPQGFLQGEVVRFQLVVFIEKFINKLFEALQFRRIVHDTFLEL